MDKFTDIAQNAWGAVLVGVRKLREEGKTLDEIATILQLKNRALVSEWLSGNREAVNAPFPNMLRYLSALNLNIADFIPDTAPTIRRIGTHAPIEIVEGNNLPRVPVLMEAGAGPDLEVFTGETEMTLPVLPGYYRQGMWAVRVMGDSMAPLICRGAYVGVVPMDGELMDGCIYLVRKPPFGYVVKRVRMDNQGQIVLHSENPEYKPQIVPFEGYEEIIVARVVWGWQMYD